MPTKRRLSRAPESSRKRSSVATEGNDDFVQHLQSVLAQVMELKDGARLLKPQFVKLPSKKIYPDYYEKISDPISLAEISKKAESGQYESYEEFLQDFKLMAENASTYNRKQSVIAQDAQQIYDFVESQEHAETAEDKDQDKSTKKLTLKLGKKKDAQDSETASFSVLSRDTIMSDDIKPRLYRLLDLIIDYEKNDVVYSEVFLKEPSRKLYPDYYQIITSPMSLMTIKKKLDKDKYDTVGEVLTDFDLIWKNAQTYNEESSLIYEYATILEKEANRKIEKMLQGKDELPTKGDDSENEDSTEDHEEPVVPVKRKGRPKSVKLKLADTTDAIEEPAPIPEDPPVRKRGRPAKVKVESPMIPQKSRRGRPPLDPEVRRLRQLQKLESERLAEEARRAMNEESSDESSESDLEPEMPLDDPFSYLREKDGENALVKNVSIFSTRPKMLGGAQRLGYGVNNYEVQVANTVFQNWFEYNFTANEYKIQNSSLNLPVFNNLASKGSVTILATLNEDLVDKKYINELTVNDEKVKPSPSHTYADSDKVLTSRYDLKLAIGLNNVQISVKVLQDTTNEINSSINDENIIAKTEKEELPEEQINFWINVCV